GGVLRSTGLAAQLDKLATAFGPAPVLNEVNEGGAGVVAELGNGFFELSLLFQGGSGDIEPYRRRPVQRLEILAGLSILEFERPLGMVLHNENEAARERVKTTRPVGYDFDMTEPCGQNEVAHYA